jgi:hypothetical protein
MRVRPEMMMTRILFTGPPDTVHPLAFEAGAT